MTVREGELLSSSCGAALPLLLISPHRHIPQIIMFHNLPFLGIPLAKTQPSPQDKLSSDRSTQVQLSQSALDLFDYVDQLLQENTPDSFSYKVPTLLSPNLFPSLGPTFKDILDDCHFKELHKLWSQQPIQYQQPLLCPLFLSQLAIAQEAYERELKRRLCEDEFTIDLDLLQQDGRTALMIKNIPNKYSQTALMQEINDRHFEQYDFFYLPMDYKNHCNVGYAFINFLSTAHIRPFYNNFNQRKWNKFNSDKVCELKYARIQGRQSLVQHFQNNPTMQQKDRKHRPVIKNFRT